MSDDKNNNNFGKQMAATATGLALTALTIGGDGCKTKNDPSPQTTDTTGTTTPTTPNKDSLAQVQWLKDSAAIESKINVGKQWAEFYGEPTAETSAALAKVKTAAVQPAYISGGANLLARIYPFTVNPNDSYEAANFIPKLDAIPNAYVKTASGDFLLHQGRRVLNTTIPEVRSAIVKYTLEAAGKYKGVLVDGLTTEYAYDNVAKNGGVGVAAKDLIAGEREALASAIAALKAAGKEDYVGDMTYGTVTSGFEPLTKAVGSSTTVVLRAPLNNTEYLQQVLVSQPQPTNFVVSFTSPEVSDASAKLAHKVVFDALKKGHKESKILPASVNAFVATDANFLAQGDIQKNLDAKSARIAAKEQVQQLPANTMILPGAKAEGVVVGELTNIQR